MSPGGKAGCPLRAAKSHLLDSKAGRRGVSLRATFKWLFSFFCEMLACCCCHSLRATLAVIPSHRRGLRSLKVWVKRNPSPCHVTVTDFKSYCQFDLVFSYEIQRFSMLFGYLPVLFRGLSCLGWVPLHVSVCFKCRAVD